MTLAMTLDSNKTPNRGSWCWRRLALHEDRQGGGRRDDLGDGLRDESY